MNIINIGGSVWTLADLIPFFFAGTMVITMVWYWRQTERWYVVPSMLTGFGILGTFIGIIIGLWDFDVSNVIESVPTLLSGLKTAFITSILGMAFSLFWKVVRVPVSASTIKQQKKEVDIVQQIDRVVSAITGTEDGSLITQIQRMRMDITDQFKAQNNTMESMLDAISKNNTELLIESLRTVVEDFDSKINERLGQTFDDLAKAAVNLVEWQSNHKQQMVDLIDQYRELSDKLELSINHQTAMTAQTSQMENLAEEMLAVSGEVNKMADSVVSTTVAAQDWLARTVEKLEAHGDGVIAQLESNTTRILEQVESQTVKTLETYGSHLVTLSSKLTDDYGPLVDKLQQLNKVVGESIR